MVIPSYLQGISSSEPGPFDWEKINVLFDSAYKEHPEDKHTIDLIRVMYLMLEQRHQDCIDLGLEALKYTTKDDDVIELCICIARSYEDLFDSEKAIKYYQKAFKKSNEPLPEVIFELAEIYKKQRKYEKVIETYQLGLVDEYIKYECLCNIGEAYMNLKDFDYAEYHIDLAIELEPTAELAYNNMGNLYAEKKDNLQAMEYFKKQLEVAEDKSVANYCIGLCWQNEGDYYRAMQYYTEALKIDPKFPEVYNNISKLVMEHEGDIKESIRYLEKAVEECENESAKFLFYMNLYRIYSKLLIDYDQAAYYQKKYFECLGFPVEIRQVDENDPDADDIEDDINLNFPDEDEDDPED
jgi:tetratricopeptide (TPR) repeat protein